MLAMAPRPLILAIALALHAAGAGAATVTVHDARTLAAALARARIGKRIDRIVLAPGTYALAETIVIDERLSGRPGHPFELVGAPGAGVILSGAPALPPLRWEPWRDGIWRARYDGPSFQRLWLDGRRLVRARYPNVGPDPDAFIGAADATAPARVARWRDPAGGVLHALHGLGWGGVLVPILGKDANGNLRYGTQVANNRAIEPSKTARWVENVFEELDAPGEWFNDRADGWLYLKPVTPGRPPARGFHAGALDTLVRVAGQHRDVHDVVVRNLVFTRAEPTVLQAQEPLLRSDWKFARSGAVTVEHARDVRIADGEFTDLGGQAVVVNGRATHIAITGNHIHGIGATAIAFVGRPEAVRSPLFEYHEQLDLDKIDRTPGPASDDYPRDSSAADNLIHDVGTIDKQAAGVEISMAARITIDHNSIYHVPRAGINVGDGNWGGHRITHNDVFDTVLESGDHGAFNSWGRDRYWHPDRAEMDRRVAADPGLALLDAVEPIVMRYNRFRCDHGWDVDLDDGASNYVIESNLLLSGGLKLREGFARVVRNNIFVNNTFHPHVWFDASGDVFERNIVMAPYQPIGIRHWGRSVDRNLFTTGAALAAAQARGTDAGSIVADPAFAAPLAGDYTVTDAAAAARIGFENFSMSDFGVRPARLKAQARKPSFATPAHPADVGLDAAPQSWGGMTMKDVRTAGEQSAAGLGRIAGVLVLAVEPGSPAAIAGFRARDVIVGSADGKALDDVAALKAWMDAAPAGARELVIVRNQAQIYLATPHP
jgi:hypothetical protein